MAANQALFAISIMSKTLGVSRSGYYAWRERRPSQRWLADAELTARIKAIHAASRETYGAPRVHAALSDEGVQVGRKRVERLMKVAAIAGDLSPKFPPADRGVLRLHCRAYAARFSILIFSTNSTGGMFPSSECRRSRL